VSERPSSATIHIYTNMPMPLDPFKDFLIACVGASASFIGLLFVALSVVLARGDAGAELQFNDRRLAESSFTALANIFFVSLAALIAGTNIGYTALIASLFGLRNVWRLVARLRETRKTRTASDIKKDIFWIAGSVVIYAVQGIYAIRIIGKPADVSNLYAMAGILIGLFGVALVRTWKLTGIRAK
jgi:hypothetical protein